MAEASGTDQSRAPLAIITGASSGIGREIARLVARRGYRTMLIARRTQRLESLALELSRWAPSTPVTLDLSEPDGVERTLPPLLAEHGPASLLVNDAGYGLYREFLEHTQADLYRLMQVNFFASISMIRVVLPAMIRRRQGQVINVASMSSKVGPWGHAGYAAAKAAVVSLTQTLAAEHAADGIHFSYVNPGIVSSEYFECNSFGRLMKRVAHRSITPEHTARRIVSLLDRPRLELCIPRYYRLLDLIAAVSPVWAHDLVRRNSLPSEESAVPENFATPESSEER